MLLARLLRRRSAVVLALLVLAAVTTLVAGRSASRGPVGPAAAASPALSANFSAAKRSGSRGPLRPAPFSARKARRGHLARRFVLSHPRRLFLRAAHSRVFDVRKLHGKVVKQERPEVGELKGEREAAAVASASSALPKTLQRHDAASISAPAPAPLASFDGLDFANWGAGHPPDENGDVGPTYYLQTVNTSIGIYDKSTGTRVAAFTFNSFMSQGSFGNLCDTNNFGDPVVLYDSFEDRWFISDFAFKLDGSGNVSPQHVYQCFAVSKTGDPVSGGWNFYWIEAPGGLDDYPKFGVWPDGIYMSANMFGYASNSSFAGTHVWALNKAQMYAGEPTVQVVDFQPPSSDFTLLPANSRLQAGSPPPGTPEYFVSTWQYLNALTVYKLHVDWDKISTSTFTGPDTPTSTTCWPNSAVPNIPTPANSLDALQIRGMAQAQYSNLGGAESLWVDHTVRRGEFSLASCGSGSSTGAAAVRWYQVNVTGGTVAPSLVQAKTWDPDGTDTLHRWMPSLALDRAGDLAVGYSEANATTNPKIVYAGRLAGDAANTFSQGEQTLIAGTGSQSGICGSSSCARWGDYSGMTLDPSDGCTFWMTNEYYAVTGLNDLTRIGAFRFPGCTNVGNGTLSGTVTDGTTALAGVAVSLGVRTTTTDGSGHYSFTVPAGTYPVLTASKAGFVSASASGISVPDGGTATRNFALGAAAQSGCIADSTQAEFQRGIPSSCDLVANPGSVQLSNQTILDQKNETLGNTGSGITTTLWSGQTFTPAVSGPLTKAEINLFCSVCVGTTPNLTLSIRATSGGLPTGADLASATIPGFSSGSAIFYSATFASPVNVTAGTRYALVVRPVTNPSAGTYAVTRSNSDVYAGGARVSSNDGGATWSAQVTDLGFRVYVNTGFPATGTFLSSLKDANPAAGRTPKWTTLSWTATTPGGTGVKFQVAGSNSSSGPFSYVGPDGTAGSFFTASGASLSQFNGFRYLRYKAILSTSSGSVTPTLSSVSVCFDDVVPTTTTPTSLTADPASGPYGGTTTLAATLTAGGSPLSGKTVDFKLLGSSVGSSTTSASGVATLSGVSLSGIGAGSYPGAVSASFAGDSGYDPSNDSSSLTVSRADQVITFPAIPDFSWQGGSATLTATASSGLAVSYSVLSGSCSVSGSVLSATHAGSCTVAADQAGNANYNAASQVTRNASVTKAAQAITVTTDAPASAIFDMSFGVAATGGGSGNPVVFSSSGACSNSGDTFTMTSGTGTCTVKYDQAGNGDYDPAPQVTELVSAQKADQTITVTTDAPSSAVYLTSFDVAATAPGGPVSFSSGGGCSNTGNSFTMTSGTGTCTVKYDQAGDANYNAAPQVTESVNAQKASQTITVITHAPAEAAANTSFNVAAGGGGSGNPIVYSSEGSCTNTGSAYTMISGSGTCTVKYDEAGDANYDAAPEVTESVTAKQGSQTITVTTHAPGSAVFGSTFTVAAVGGDSGNPVTFSSAGSCSNSDDTFTMTSGTGTCTVKYDQAGDADYAAAGQVTESVDAQKASQTIGFGSLPDKTVGDPDFTVSATASSGLGVAFGASGQCTISGSTVHLTGAGSCTITASQAGDDNYNAAADVPQTFQITSPQVSEITDTSATCSQVSAGGAVGLATLFYSQRNGKISDVQPRNFVYWVRVTASGGSNTFTINQAITTGNFSVPIDVGSGAVYSSACGTGPRDSTSQSSDGTVTLRFNASAAGTYFLAVTYKSTSVKGQKPPTPNTTAHYDFSTQGVPGSTSGIDLSARLTSSARLGHVGRFFWLLRR